MTGFKSNVGEDEREFTIAVKSDLVLLRKMITVAPDPSKVWLWSPREIEALELVIATIADCVPPNEKP